MRITALLSIQGDLDTRLLVIRRADELSVKGRATVIVKIGNKIREHGLRDIDAILIIGFNVNIKSSLPPVLSMHNIPLAILAKNNISILINPIGTMYNNYRRMQYQLDKVKALNIVLEYIKAKVNGLKNILRYYRVDPPDILPPPSPMENAEKYELEVRLWESTSSHQLWYKLVELLKPDTLDKLRKKYGFTGRKPRRPDPFNKTLSVMYAVFYSLATKALIASGLDPTYGFLHRTRYSTPLTFDYTEMFKPIAIQATIEMINKEGLPEIGEDGELTRESVNKAIRQLYNYLTLRHKKTGKTPYQYIFLKAYTLAKHLEGKIPQRKLTITWNRADYKTI